MKRVLLLSILMLIGFMGRGYGFECSKENVEKELNVYFMQFIRPDLRQDLRQDLKQEGVGVQFKVIEVRKVNLAGIEFCEAVWKIEDERTKGRVPVEFKNVAYFRENMMVMGDIKVKESGVVKHVSQDRHMEVNKEALEFMAQMQREMSKEDEARQEEIVKQIEKIRKQADLVMATKGARHEIVIFADPYCPYCKQMQDVVMALNKDGKLDVRVILVGLLGPDSERLVASVLCEKDDKERMKMINDKVVKSQCEAGKKKAKANVELFHSLKGRGVPLSVLIEKQTGKVVRVFNGMVGKEVIEREMKGQ